MGHIRARPALSNLPQARTFPAHSPIKAPRMNGVSLVNTIEFVGRFPSKTLCGNSFSKSSGLFPAACSSFRASSVDFPFIRASVWAKKLAGRIL